MARHFLNLPGASTIKTAGYEMTKLLVPTIVDNAAIGTVYGPAGNGKTYAVEAALERLSVPIIKIASLRRPTMKYIALSVLQGLTGIRAEGELMRLTDDLMLELAGERRLIVIDEAQNLSTECFEYLRHLHDDGSTDFALLFVGGNRCWEVISRHPMLQSRVWHWVEFTPLSIEDVLEIIPRYHPIYKGVDPELLLEIDDEFAHGTFRNWAAFTNTALLQCKARRTKRINRIVVDAAKLFHVGGMDAQAA